ncbi:hypothetical protein JL720_12054 [Aureococcus anophagefferens]|nr:hypothetical protein JL720_12054 [Aureococcus anophagefferens]
MRLRCCSADVVDDVVLTEPSDAAVGGQPVSCDHPPVEQESDAPAEDDAPEDSALVTKRWHVYPSHVESDHKATKAAELLAALRAEPGFDEWRWYFDDAAVLRRFLTARDDNVAKAKALLLDALAWRGRRRPHVIDYAEMERERAGKLRVAESLDRWGRPVVVFDNTVQNTKDSAAQLRCLAFVLEHALRRVDGTRVSKYVIFMHLSDFSLFNNPPWSVTRETMLMLMSCFAECCGHIVVHGAPRVFRGVFAAVKPLIDPKTATKIVFVSPGDAEEPIMRDLVGDDWRALTGAGLARETPASSQATATAVLAALAADEAWRKRTGNAGRSATPSSTGPRTPPRPRRRRPARRGRRPAADDDEPKAPPRSRSRTLEPAERVFGLHPLVERALVLALAFCCARVVTLLHALVEV